MNTNEDMQPYEGEDSVIGEMTDEEAEVLSYKEETSLRNKNRDRMHAMGLNVDDMDTKTLNKADRIIDACEKLSALRRQSFVNNSSVARETNITRKTLGANPDYRKIIDYYRDEPVRIRDERVKELEEELAKYKRATAEYDMKLKAALAEGTKTADVYTAYKNECASHKTTRDALTNANAQIENLRRENTELRNTLHAMKGRTNTLSN